MVVGSLVRCDHGKVGTVIKVTDYELGHENWTDSNRYAAIRPGKVVSVRWQDDPTKKSVHVFYRDDEEGSIIDIGGVTGLTLVTA